MNQLSSNGEISSSITAAVVLAVFGALLLLNVCSTNDISITSSAVRSTSLSDSCFLFGFLVAEVVLVEVVDGLSKIGLHMKPAGKSDDLRTILDVPTLPYRYPSKATAPPTPPVVVEEKVAEAADGEEIIFIGFVGKTIPKPL